MALFPDFINPFQPVGYLSVAVLLSQLRIRLFITFSSLLFIAGLLPPLLGAPTETGESVGTLVFTWLLAAVLGLAAAGLEQRINDEIDLRERLAIQHQRDLDYVRLKMALDTHDLMSHGLATEHAIMRMMGVDARAEGRHEERLTELALVNSHTQYQLRILLTRLTDNPRGRPHIGNLENEMTTAAEMVRLAANTGGYNVQIQLGTLACKASIDFIEIALFILKELATNAIKHAALPHSCSISVHIRQRGGQDWLHFNACNPSSDEPRHMPRSLTTRVDQAGGELRLRHSAGLLSVEVDVPVAAGDTK